MNAEAVLLQAAAVVAERGMAYGEAAVSMDRVARRWSNTLGRPVTPAEVVLCLIDLKLVRLTHDPKHLDSAIDIAGFAALLPEVAR
jgi:hypothetical protein